MAEKEKKSLDASEFTVSAIEAETGKDTDSRLQKKAAEKAATKAAADKSKIDAKMAAKYREQVMKPPPAKVQVERMKQEMQKTREEEEVEKKSVFTTINAYYQRFPGLREKFPELTPKTSLAEADEILALIRETMNSAGSIRTLAEYVNTGFTMIEKTFANESFKSKLPDSIKWDLTGLSQFFREGKFPELDPIIMEIDIEYPWIGRRPLIWRAIQAIQISLMKVHIYNTNPAARKIFEMAKSKPVPKPDGADDL
jgi:hypothetical protein